MQLIQTSEKMSSKRISAYWTERDEGRIDLSDDVSLKQKKIGMKITEDGEMERHNWGSLKFGREHQRRDGVA